MTSRYFVLQGQDFSSPLSLFLPVAQLTLAAPGCSPAGRLSKALRLGCMGAACMSSWLLGPVWVGRGAGLIVARAAAPGPPHARVHGRSHRASRELQCAIGQFLHSQKVPAGI